MSSSLCSRVHAPRRLDDTTATVTSGCSLRTRSTRSTLRTLGFRKRLWTGSARFCRILTTPRLPRPSLPISLQPTRHKATRWPWEARIPRQHVALSSRRVDLRQSSISNRSSLQSASQRTSQCIIRATESTGPLSNLCWSGTFSKDESPRVCGVLTPKLVGLGSSVVAPA